MNLPSASMTRQEHEPDAFWEDDDLPEGGLHVMFTTRTRVLSVTLDPGEITVRTRGWYFQPVFSASLHLLATPRWACLQAGTRTWRIQETSWKP